MSDLSRYVEPLAEAVHDVPFFRDAGTGCTHRLFYGACSTCTAKALLSPGGIIDRIVTEALAEQRAQVLNAAADEFVELAAIGWGGDAAWLTTGTKVGDVVRDTLRQMAESALDGDTTGAES